MKKVANFLLGFMFIFISIFAVLFFVGVNKMRSAENQYSFYRHSYRIVKASNDTAVNFNRAFQLLLLELVQRSEKPVSVIFFPTDRDVVNYLGDIPVGIEAIKELSGRRAEPLAISRESRGIYFIASDASIEKQLMEIIDVQLDRLENLSGFLKFLINKPVLSLYFFAISASFILLVFLMNSAVQLEGSLIRAHRLAGATFWKYQFFSFRYDGVAAFIGGILGFAAFVGITRGVFFGYSYRIGILMFACIVGVFLYFSVRAALNYIHYWLSAGGGNAVSRVS